jgi:hypothetical protein
VGRLLHDADYCCVNLEKAGWLTAVIGWLCYGRCRSRRGCDPVWRTDVVMLHAAGFRPEGSNFPKHPRRLKRTATRFLQVVSRVFAAIFSKSLRGAF